MKTEILCVGTELLLGDIVNTNAAYLSRELALLGVEVYHHTVVGDNPQRLAQALNIAFSRSDTVVMTGGLGPTYDDLTKETVADYFHCPLKLHQPSLNAIEDYFARTGRELTENNKKQAMLPEGCTVFPNSCGTAPGFALTVESKTAILLPGPPIEMTAMFELSVRPYLEKRSQKILVSHNVHIFGLGESHVESLLKPMMTSYCNPTIAPYAKQGEVRIRVTASAGSPEEGDRLIAPVLGQIQDALPDVVYGIDVDSLQGAVVQTLMQRGLKLATAESCTGGLISKRITEIPGSSQVFDCGICSYANSIKETVLGVSHQTLCRYGAVSPQTAQEMAQGVRKLAEADIAVSTTGIAGPDGGTPEKPVGLVYIAVDSPWYSQVMELHLSRGRKKEREDIRYLASSHALNLVLQALRKAPLPDESDCAELK